MNILIPDEQAMLALGAELAGHLRVNGGGGVVHVKGDLGAGKTTLCRGILRALGHEGAVKSPTFTLVEPYELDGLEVFHFDLYRLADPDELEYIGIDDYYGDNRLCLIEWPEKAEGHLVTCDLELAIDVAGEKRNIGIIANTVRGEKICEALSTTF